jgi:hypothetical protein
MLAAALSVERPFREGRLQPIDDLPYRLTQVHAGISPEVERKPPQHIFLGIAEAIKQAGLQTIGDKPLKP